MSKWKIVFLALCFVVVLYGLYDEFLKEDPVDTPAITTRNNQIQAATTSSGLNAASLIRVINTSTKEIHRSSCSWVDLIDPNNKRTVSVTSLSDLLDEGYTYCEHCN